jgi:TrmH RNA methyltransferase
MQKETKYYGIHACLALAERRPGDIVRVYLDETNLKTFSSLLRWCAKERRAYHIVGSGDLDRLSDSIHHEGVCILAKERLSVDELTFEKNLPEKVCLIYLDGVENPHNIGSILRTASHFGVPYILGENLSLSASACRIAKGGAEIVQIVSLAHPKETLFRLETKGFKIIATSAHRGESLYRFSFPPRSIIAIGSESKGLKSSFLKQAQPICVPGTGAVESLNVSVATALCMGEYFHQHGK